MRRAADGSGLCASDVSDSAAMVLRALAAAGGPVPLEVLGAVVAAERGSPGDALSELDDAGLLVWHDEGRAVASSSNAPVPLQVAERARLRGALGRALRSAGNAPAVAVAEMLLDGSSVEPDSAVVPSLVAYSAELQYGGRVDDAIDVLTTVADAIDRGQPVSPVARVQAVTRLGFLLRFSGRAEEAAALAARVTNAARASGDTNALASAALAWRPESIVVSDDPYGVALVDEVLAREDVDDPGIRARLLAARAEAMVFTDLATAHRDASEALRLAREAGEPEAFVLAAYAYRVARWHPSRQDEMLALGSEMVAVSPAMVDYREFGAVTRLQVFLERGDWAHVDGELEAMSRRLAASSGPLEMLWFRVVLAARAQTKGDWEEATRLIDTALNMTGGPDYRHALGLLLTQQLITSWQRGEDLTALRTNEVAPAGPMRPSWEAALLGWTCTTRQRSDVVAELDRLLVGGLDSIRPDLTFGPAIASLAMAAAEAASVRHATILFDGMRPYADQWAGTGGAVVLGPFALHAGRLAQVLGRSADAHELLRAATESARVGDCAPWLARCELAVAELHASTGRSPSTVRRHARVAHALADQCGMTEVAARAGRLHGQVHRPAGLTAREADALRELATGATNQDIAERLHLSVKTVERHLLNAYRKAGVRNRAEAAAFVTRELTES